IFFIESLQQPNKQIKVDTIEFEMANPDGSLMGEGFSDIKESKLIYKLNESFKLKGQYKLKIQQAVRETGKINPDINLQGITEVGLRIENKD
ncbi:MAG: gliding motility lipoprotein GldH, partial [Flavobacterium sp.]|nr:gliding motility lipoprotein GldH [Flavobacterium sp.]